MPAEPFPPIELVCDESSCAARVKLHAYFASNRHLAGVRAAVTRSTGWQWRSGERGWRPVCPRCSSERANFD